MLRTPRPRHSVAAAALLVAAPLAPALADDLADSLGPYPDAPAPRVEIDVSPGLMDDLFGVTDGALAGVATALAAFGDAGDSPEHQAAELTVEQIAAVKHVVELAKDAVRGVRLRVYGDVSEAVATEMVDHYDARVEATAWERVLRVREDDPRVQVALLRDDGAVHGVLLVVCDSPELVTVHVDCDLSAEKAEELAETLTSTALRLGLAEELEDLVEEIREEVEEGIERR